MNLSNPHNTTMKYLLNKYYVYVMEKEHEAQKD